MDYSQLTDPFTWDVDTVAAKLCSLARPCTRNQDDLISHLRENEIDGHTLLTYELVGFGSAHDLRNELFQALNIKLAKHKNALGEAIMEMRASSSAFRKWKIDHLNLGEQDAQTTSTARGDGICSHGLTTHSDLTQLQQRSRGDKDEHGAVAQTPQIISIASNDTSQRPPEAQVVPSATEVYRTDSRVSTTPTKRLSELFSAAGVAREESPGSQPKRRRIMPRLILDQPLNTSPVPIATEADVLRHPKQEIRSNNPYPWDGADGMTYLGAGSLPEAHIKSSDIPITNQIRENDDCVGTTVPTRLPIGRRLVVYKAMRRMLERNNKLLSGAEQGVDLSSPEGTSSGGERILELDDLLDDLDEETLREMEAEAAEEEEKTKKRAKALKSVSRDRARQILDEEISEMTKVWQKKKLPRYERKAYSLWSDASRQDEKLIRFIEARQIARLYDERIKKLEVEILDQSWEKEKDIRLQAHCLQQSLEDRLYHLWLADILESRTPPAKPVPRLKLQRFQRPSLQEENSENEILTSDEEDFIVKDEQTPPQASFEILAAIGMDRSPSPIHPPSPIIIDLTQAVSTASPSPTRTDGAVDQPLDLKTPTETRHTQSMVEDQVPPTQNTPQMQDQPLPASWAETYVDIEQYGKFHPSHWAGQKDRFALTICLLWKLGHDRRSAVFRHVQQHDSRQSFDLTILKHIENPVQDLSRLDRSDVDTVAFEITRLFLCFLRVKNLKESRVAELKPRQIKKLEAQKDSKSWVGFRTFLTQIAPLFPQENQIYREASYDDELLGDDAGETNADLALNGEGRQKTPRKVAAAAKEIIRDKEAVDLRERELRRLAEQEARRDRLRANLGEGNIMPVDRSRLIINETKQDDQPFIYINEEIGRRIKDHQIDGVRFMWNQVIQDVDNRQGCLLSHSMGLGKTMQVITLLFAIQEASKSPNPDVVSQIPADLRASKTLVICPAGLVNNWMDELLTWDNKAILGPIYAIDANLQKEEKSSSVQQWSLNGGVLLIGYTMLLKVDDWEDGQQDAFYNTPNIVIADEAHTVKNPSTKTHQVCARFKTPSRIAMTGSPMANNIEEYYHMINWVAPNFLGPMGEFKEIYALPIQHGLDRESSGAEKRKAQKMLQVLKETVAPKVHRATIKSCMSNGLPPKQEFVLCVTPKPLQAVCYNLYAQAIRGESLTCPGEESQTQGMIFGLVNNLGLLCNHPSEFRNKAMQSIQENTKEKSEGGNLPSHIVPAILQQFEDQEPTSPSLSTKVELLIQILDRAREIKDKVLVFSHSIPSMDYLAKLFKTQKRRFSRLDGQTPIGKRQEQIKSFNANELELYLISTRAGGVGLNIQGANRVVIFDFMWNPVNEQQAIGRSYRIGQVKPVTVYHMVTAGTFEEDLHNKAIFKTQLASRVVDKKNPVSWGKRLADLKHDIREVKKKDLTKFAGKDAILDTLIDYDKRLDAIRYIVDTNTFEEEDIGTNLSVDEQKEANDMVALNRLRLSKPEEYRRLKALEAKQGAPPTSHTNVSSLTTLSGQSGNGSALVVSRSVDGVVDSMGPSQHVQLPSAAFSVRSWPRSVTVTNPSPAHVPGVVPGLPAVPMPILGAHTYFGKDRDRPPGAQLMHPFNHGSVQDSQDSAAHDTTNPFKSQIKNSGRDEFRRKMYDKLETIPRETTAHLDGTRLQTVEKVISEIDAIRKEKQFGFLPDNQHWRALAGFVEQEGCLEALFLGRIQPSDLALADKNQLEDYAASMLSNRGDAPSV